jgi:hypothetical protein
MESNTSLDFDEPSGQLNGAVSGIKQASGRVNRAKGSKASKSSGTQPLEPWVPMTDDQVRKVLSPSVHFSTKPVNTNARVVGVRLGEEDLLDMPLVAYSTTDLDRRITDYIEGGAATAKHFNPCAVVIDGKEESKYGAIDPQQRQMILDEAEKLKQHFEKGADFVDPRLRQLVVFRRDGSPIALSPLHSTTFSREIMSRIDAEKARAWDRYKAEKSLEAPGSVDPGGEADSESFVSDVSSWKESQKGKPRKRKLALMLFGGSNTQNLGKYAKELWEPMVFSGPKESMVERHRMSIFHNGISIHDAVSFDAMDELYRWREENRGAAGGIRSDVETRKEEERLVKAVASSILESANRARVMVQGFVENKSDQSDEGEERKPWDPIDLTSESLEDFDRALIDPQLRDSQWWSQFALKVVSMLAFHRSVRDEAPMAARGDLDSYIGVIESMARGSV